MTVRTDQPARLIRSLGSNDRNRTATLGSALSAGGITLEVTGPNGVVGRFGAGIDSRLGRLLTGSPAVDVRGVAATTWRGQGRVVALAAGGLAAALVLLARVRAARRG